MNLKNESLRPGLYVKSIFRVPFRKLYYRKKTYYIIDLDNTLLDKTGWISEKLVRSFKKAIKYGYIDGILILSNTIYGRKKELRVQRFAEEFSRRLNFPVDFICLSYFTRKPKRCGFQKALQKLGCDAVNAVVIGDQLMSDIKGGNRAGIFTILVDPINPENYSWTTIVSGRRWRNIRFQNKLGLAYNTI